MTDAAAIDVPALTRRRVPLMLVGTANSSSVAEHAVFFMLTLAKRAAANDVFHHYHPAGARELEREGEVLGRALLVRIDEHHVERLAPL